MSCNNGCNVDLLRSGRCVVSEAVHRCTFVVVAFLTLTVLLPISSKRMCINIIIFDIDVLELLPKYKHKDYRLIEFNYGIFKYM